MRKVALMYNCIQIIKLSQKVWNSPTVRAEMANQAKAAGKKSEVLVRAVRTRWNTVTMVLERALELRSILFNVCDKAEFNKAQACIQSGCAVKPQPNLQRCDLLGH